MYTLTQFEQLSMFFHSSFVCISILPKILDYHILTLLGFFLGKICIFKNVHILTETFSKADHTGIQKVLYGPLQSILPSFTLETTRILSLLVHSIHIAHTILHMVSSLRILPMKLIHVMCISNSFCFITE
jgi:hypothetical protein